MKYKLSYVHASSHFIQIECEIDTKGEQSIDLQFPAWRPGRYELGNFAKNVRQFKVYAGNETIESKKIDREVWQVKTEGKDSIRVQYSYFAFELNAGSTFLDEDQLYVNPVNCFIYIKGREDEPCSVQLEVPTDYQVACGKDFVKHKCSFDSYHELVDSPFIASSKLTTHSFECEGVEFDLCFMGSHNLDLDLLTRQFKGYTKQQIDCFGGFPVKRYRYLFQFLAVKGYHGVEHQASTVIALGPTSELHRSLYKELLGVSSHELYHTWNVKAIRPIEMQPYDYSKENYSRLGYVAEGVTTYMGDLFLLRGKAFDLPMYLNELTARVRAHFNNGGRHNLSVADSSFDTWIDGYVKGVPGRKVSIYTEGCLLAFLLDVRIMRASGNTKSLDDVMKIMYERFGKTGEGYSESDYRSVCEEVFGGDLSDYFDDYINSTRTIEGELMEALDYLGLELVKEENPKFSERILGMKLSGNKITEIWPGSPAEMCGLSIDDKILSVNGFDASSDTEKWLELEEKRQEMVINRMGVQIEKKIPHSGLTFYRKYTVQALEEPHRGQREAYNKWSFKKK